VSVIETVVPESCPRKTVVSSDTSSSFFIEPSFKAIVHFLRKFGICREYRACVIRDSHFSHETGGLLHLLVVTAVLPRLTDRRAATIEPTMQEPITKVRALKNKPPNNSTVLSSMRTSLRLCWRFSEARVFRIGAQITVEPCVLKSSQLSDRGSLAPQPKEAAVVDRLSKLRCNNYIPPGFWSKTSASL